MQDTIICGDNVATLREMPGETVDLVVTSPPYDNLRDYSGAPWDFEGVAAELARALKPGGVIVWVVADATVDGSETGTSFRQALHFKDACGLRLHDTMIYHRQGAKPPSLRYWQSFEYMLVLSKGRPKTFNVIRDRRNKYRTGGGRGVRHRDGSIRGAGRERVCMSEFGIRENVWRYSVGGGTIGDRICHKHPAPFPEKLARDHILSWSNPGDLVLDPFSGSGTTCKVARDLGRHFIGIDVSAEYCDLARQRLQQRVFNFEGSNATNLAN